ITYRRKGDRRPVPPADTAGPKWERPCGPADSLPTGHPPPCNPAESATLRLHSTSIRNVVTTLGLSARVRAEQGDVPNRMPGEWWDGPSSEGPAVMAGIGRRGPRWLAGSGASRSEHVMSPTDTSRYEWGSPPQREPERGACKLPTPSFPASGRAWTASTADDRGRSPWQGPATEEPCEGKLSCTVLKASGGPRGPSLSQLGMLSRPHWVLGAALSPAIGRATMATPG